MTENLLGETHRPGRIEVVCGSMFSGKTEELIRRMKRAKFAKQKVEIFKPSIDTRYSDEEVVSHDQNSIRSTPIESSGSLLLLASDIDVVGIDEAQFLTKGSLKFATNWLTVASESSLPDWIWTSREFLSARFLPCVPSQTRLPKCMPSA